MESRPKKEDGSNSGDDLNVVDHIKKLTAYNARAPLDTEEQLLLFLQSWWSKIYNRPLKDPLLQSYTLEELLYEFYDRIERTKAEEERLDQEDVKIEEEKGKADEDWAERMEREEREAEMRESGAKSQEVADPTKDPNNVKWMEEQMAKAKAQFGESFGEDIDTTFED